MKIIMSHAGLKSQQPSLAGSESEGSSSSSGIVLYNTQWQTPPLKRPKEECLPTPGSPARFRTLLDLTTEPLPTEVSEKGTFLMTTMTMMILTALWKVCGNLPPPTVLTIHRVDQSLKTQD